MMTRVVAVNDSVVGVLLFLKMSWKQVAAEGTLNDLLFIFMP